MQLPVLTKPIRKCAIRVNLVFVAVWAFNPYGGSEPLVILCVRHPVCVRGFQRESEVYNDSIDNVFNIDFRSRSFLVVKNAASIMSGNN